jgi:hypothetical protein
MEKDLEDLTVTKLREEAKKYSEITGVHAMRKAELIEAIRKASVQPKKKEKKTAKKLADRKTDLKKRLRALKVQREKALEDRDRKALKSIRTRMKKLKRKTRRVESTASGIS